MRGRTCMGWHGAAVVVGACLASGAWAEGIRPRTLLRKPERASVPAWSDPTLLMVKLRDGFGASERGGRLVWTHTALDLRAAGVPTEGWRAGVDLPHGRVHELRTRAEQRLGREIMDLTQVFYLRVPEGEDPRALLDRLNGLEAVEIALAAPRPAPPPAPGNFEVWQRYLTAAPDGVAAWDLWELPGGRGSHVAVADVEYAYMPHNDLPPIETVGSGWVDPYPPGDHGTAVLGVMGAMDNKRGTTGAVPDAELLFVGTYNGSSWDVGRSILLLASRLEAGDVVLIEQQMAGPNAGSNQYGLVPVSWWPAWHAAIEVAVGNGICVIEAAGNGSQNLDAAVYRTGNGGHHPFTPETDHGGITVGAGGSVWGANLQRLAYSNYGSTIDLQGWGQDVLTPGLGGFHDEPGWGYTWFSGTSSATPVVASAAAALQSVHRAVRGEPIDPVTLRDVLRATGTAQLPSSAQNIGPRPDAAAALWAIFGDADCNANGIPDEIDVAMGEADVNGNLVPDACETLCPADLNKDGAATVQDLLAYLGWFGAGDERAEITGDGRVGVDDLVAYLAAFGAGC